MKVLLTTDRCTPALTRTIVCDTMRYFDSKRKLLMYDKKGHLCAYAMIDEWAEVSYICKGKQHYIKRRTEK